MKRPGVADLPLHGGRVPQWLAERMNALAQALPTPSFSVMAEANFCHGLVN
jgi:hypothetical protein